MKKLCALAFSLVLTLPQILPTAFAPAGAQAAAPAAPPAAPPAPAAPAVAANPGPMAPPRATDSSFPAMGSFGADVCRPVVLTQAALLPSLVPPNEWRDKFVKLYVEMRQDGSVEKLHLLRSSGIEALDAAVLAQARQNWHWAPLACNRVRDGQDVTARVPRATCRASGWAPAMPLALAQQSRSVAASVDFSIQPDGRMTDLRLTDSSGDAALDAAMLAHIRQYWQYWPLAEGCGVDKRHVQIRFRDADCTPMPVLDSRSIPEVLTQDRPRAADFQIGVGPDGKPLFVNLVRSSGDAALDMAAAAHVKAAWRWQPISCKRTEIYARGSALPVIDIAHIDFPVRQRAASN